MKTSTVRLRTKPAGRYVGLAASTMEKLRLTGDGPPFLKLGRTVVYDTDDLDSWLASRRRRSTSDVACKQGAR
jgi:hypothetical protein